MRCVLPLTLILLTTSLEAQAERVAVLYFDNNTKDKDLDLLQKGMADMLITDLSGLDGVTILEREKLNALLGELKLQRTKYFNPKTALKLGKGLGATHTITGAFNGIGKKLRIDVRLIDVASGKVVTTDKVTGKKKAFFELEQQLTKTFACKLSPGSCSNIVSVSANASLPALLQYSEGLSLADTGDLEQASKAMKGAMKKAPKFGPAKKRYFEIMKRIYAAKQVRSSALSKSEEHLNGRIEQVLQSGESGKQAAYRILRGQLVLKRIDALFDDLAARQAAPNKKDMKLFRDLIVKYRDSQKELLSYLKRINDTPSLEIDEEDIKAGQDVGLGDEPGNLDFYSAVQIQRDLGSFLLTAKEPFWGTFRWSKSISRYYSVRIDTGLRAQGQINYKTVPRPPIRKLDPGFDKEGLRFLDQALKGTSDQEETIKTLDAWAQALYEVGKPEDAIAKWQTILEKYPKSEAFKDIEHKIRQVLSGKTP